jgi:hypothetical protein
MFFRAGAAEAFALFDANVDNAANEAPCLRKSRRDFFIVKSFATLDYRIFWEGVQLNFFRGAYR